MKRRVVLLGPPGSGKGTVAGRLEIRFGLEHVSTGQWFRKEIDSGSRLGEEVKDYLNRGELVPDQVVLSLLDHWLTADLLKRGFLFDGFPRTLVQGEALDRFCAARSAPIDIVLYLKCPEEVILERITGRRVCGSCGKGYHVRNMQPQVPGVCDVCGGQLIQREDDTEPVVRSRLEFYERNTAPLVDYYSRSGRLVRLNAALGSEAATATAAKALEA